jgi:hypothetical protein
MPYTPDDSVQIATPSTTTPNAPSFIKTFDVRDSNGNVVSIQAVALVNEYGRIINVMTEQTGQDIVDMLEKLLAYFTSGDVRSTD